MKNIHILPTDKQSRLFYLASNLHLEQGQLISPKNYQNIYITNDEQAKEGDWGYIPFQGGDVKLVGKYFADDWKKIILTTDQDLINNGVQKIDDDFLEWFVKNPSCEEVEVQKGKMKLNDDGQEYGFPDMSLYKIIIPKEEQKQHLIDIMRGDEELGLYEEPKQETLEEYISKVTKNFGHEMSIKFTSAGIKLGAKWQAEKMYSEAIEFAEWIRIKDFQTASKDNWIGLDMKYYTTEELFEQFKKK